MWIEPRSIHTFLAGMSNGLSNNSLSTSKVKCFLELVQVVTLDGFAPHLGDLYTVCIYIYNTNLQRL